MENIITKNSDLRHEIVRGRMRERDKPRIIQDGVVSKGLREEFSFRDRRDGRGAIRIK
ncbi:hypothetical protein E2C01_055355 [Portunus trituberculatus]|uniref:Uncharacterized protein n=1 Tax=Portunus trituberculatus TaxID=210409 RepID=A0A5B7GUK2_PORTR|nr:hypothetical protein [Portunus trituberculatus]